MPGPVKVEMQNPSFDPEAALRAWLDAVAAGFAAKYADVLIDEGYDSITEIQLATEQDLRDAAMSFSPLPFSSTITHLNLPFCTRGSWSTK